MQTDARDLAKQLANSLQQQLRNAAAREERAAADVQRLQKDAAGREDRVRADAADRGERETTSI